MSRLARTLGDGATYRRLLYLLSSFPLGNVWFVALVTVWSLCLGLAITPLVIPLVVVLGFMTRAFAAVEASLAGSLLDVELAPVRVPRWGGGLWRYLRALLGEDFWRAQGYLFARWFLGLPLAASLFAVLATALGLTFAPAWVPFVHGGAHLGFWRPHTFVQSLALVPVGLMLLPVAPLLAAALATPVRALAVALLGSGRGAEMETAVRTPHRDRAGRLERALRVHAAADATLLFLLVLIWAITSRGYFWPVWPAMVLAFAIGIHAWFTLLALRPQVLRRFRGNRTLAGTVGVAVASALYFTAIWGVTSAGGYFWPVWPILGLGFVVGIQTAAALLSAPGEAELTERIETLETSRAGAVDVQDSELRRIERDLHDGAQARLVALGMSLGMAEQKLARDPEAAGQLLAEARVGAAEALRELRDLARGIHPPVLADRGLQAAIEALAIATPMNVTVNATVTERPPSTVESAAYFVVAEALANAAKHARAQRVRVDIARTGDVLTVAVEDDGRGGAEPQGTGLSGLRRRVDALDGTLSVTSPAGGPTTVRAELPCG